MLKIGLTGGIGCGKTTVGNLFSALNIPVIDADNIAHKLVAPGQPALVEIKNIFGCKLINADGSLNRSGLRDIVFFEPSQKKKLEALLHPRIFAAMRNEIDTLESPYCILCIPLLFETEKTSFVDRILVIDCPVETQIERVKLRDNINETTIQAIIDSQICRNLRISRADDIIDNSAESGKLAESVKKLHNFYLSISTPSGQTPP